MTRIINKITIAFAIILLFGCDSGMETWDEDYAMTNPFLEGKWEDEGKEDTGYLNLRGIEVHATLEADVNASSWRIFDAPPELAQFALTYLRNRQDFYLEILAEDATAADRVEWLVDGEWLSRQAAENVDSSKLTHFRMQEVNAVVLNRAADDVHEGQVFHAEVPIKPFSVFQDAGDDCADYNSHIDLDQSVYWYLWNPGKSSCSLDTQSMTLTVAEVLPHNPESYPEYDELWADSRLDVVVLFGKMDDGDVADDYNWQNVRKLSQWLTEAGFAEEENPPLGRRFVKQVGDLTEVVDIYGPDIFHNVADYARLHNWQKAVSEHEVVMYNGHSVLGTGMAFERAQYPDFYQIFQVASCLSYEYYVRPVLAGKGSWENVDVLSNVEPTYYSENLPLTSTILAKLIWGFENDGQASWQDIMEAVSRKLGHSRFGVSGARGNCFSPEGDQCNPDPDPDPDVLHYENTAPVEIPDNDTGGAFSTIEVTDDVVIESLDVEINLTHTYIGDLKIVLTHNGVSEVLWNRSGGSNDDIRAVFPITSFNGQAAAGTWTLQMVDNAGQDTGRLNLWAINIIQTRDPDPDPDPDTVRIENNDDKVIPDNDASGATSIIQISNPMTIGSLSVEIDATHSYVGDLVIVLSHNGTDHVIWNREGGSSDDIRKSFSVPAFNGTDAAGVWTLHVTDRAAQDTGILNSWALVITPGDGPDPDDRLRYADNVVQNIPDNAPAGITSVIEVPDQVNIAALAVEIDITHTYVGDLKVVLSHAGVDRVLWDHQGGGSSDIHQTFSPADFNGTGAAGPWTLSVSDNADRDTGSLNSWAILITPAG